MAKKKRVRLKTQRFWLEKPELSNSWILLRDDYDGVDLQMGDCSRSICWSFGPLGEDRGKQKITKIKAVVDLIYNHYHRESGE